MQMLIDGKWVGGAEEIHVHRPLTRRSWTWSRRGQGTMWTGPSERLWRDIRSTELFSSGERARILRRTAELLEERQEEFAILIAREGSKTIREARKEAYRCTQTLRVSGEEATRILGETISFRSAEGIGKPEGVFLPIPHRRHRRPSPPSTIP